MKLTMINIRYPKKYLSFSYLLLGVAFIIWGTTTWYATDAQAQETTRETQTDQPEGFLGLRTIQSSKGLEGLRDDEIRILEALKNVVDSLSRGKTVEQILNECDQYSDAIFGDAPSVGYGEPIKFFALKIEQNNFDVLHLRIKKNPKEIFLLNGSGFIHVSQNGIWQDMLKNKEYELEHNNADAKAPTLEQLTKEPELWGDMNGEIWNGDEVYQIEVHNYSRRDCLALQFYERGSLKLLCWRKHEYNPEQIQTSAFHFPAFVTKNGWGTISWDKNGKITWKSEDRK